MGRRRIVAHGVAWRRHFETGERQSVQPTVHVIVESFEESERIESDLLR